MEFKLISRQTHLNEPVYDLSVLELAEDYDVISFDGENTGLDVFTLKPILLGFSVGGGLDENKKVMDADYSFIIDLLTYGIDEVREALAPLVKKKWIIHNAVYDYMVMQHHFGIKLPDVHCTMVCSQVLYNGSDAWGHNYKEVVYRHFDMIVNKEDVQAFVNRDLSRPIEEFELKYLKNDLRYLKPLYQRQLQLGAPDKKNLLKCFELENKFIKVMAHMMVNGIAINGNKWIENYELYNEQAEELRIKIKDKAIELYESFGIHQPVKSKRKYAKNQVSLFSDAEMTPVKYALRDFNANSPLQIAMVLKNVGVVTDGTGEDELRKLLYDITDERVRDFINILLDLRGYEKLVSTYGLNFLNENLNPVTFKMHTNYSQAFTDTGRLSSSKPNLQNIPKRKEIRDCFVPDDAELYELASLDMSGQELRIAGSRSQDSLILANFNKGLDFHSILAQDSYRIIKNDPNFIVSKEVNEDLRDLHKQVIFGYIFGATHYRVADVLNIPVAVAKLVLEQLERNVPELSAYQNEMKKKVYRDGFVVDGSMYNRMQTFLAARKKPLSRHSIEKKGVNFPIQATAASMTKEAGIEILNYIEENNLDCQIKLQIHDEYLIQIPKGRKDLAEKFKEIMEEVGNKYLVGLKMESSMKIGNRWLK